MKIKLLALTLLVAGVAFAQENDKVMAPINLLFEGMKKGDSAMVHRAFVADAKLYAIYPDAKTKQPALKRDSFAGFLIEIGSPHRDVWNELIWSPKIEIDGNFAQVWAPYAFYAGTKFSHCGVDAFHLFKDSSGQWKIFHLADTRHKEGCNVPLEVSSKIK